MQSATHDLIVVERLLEAAREIGILLVAFAPLDFALSGQPHAYWLYLLGFLFAGVTLLSAGILGEWRLRRWRDSSSR